MRVVLLAVGCASIFASAGRMTFGKTYQKSGILNGTWGFDGHNCTISLSPRLPAGVNPSANSQLLRVWGGHCGLSEILGINGLNEIIGISGLNEILGLSGFP